MEQISNPSPEATATLRTLNLDQSRIALQMEDPHLFALCFHRILAEGGTPVLAPTPEEARHLGVRSVIDDHGQRLLDGPHLPARENTYLAFSSGSTGQRRPLHFCAERARANALAHARALDLKESHLLLQTLRLHHPFGVVAYLFAPQVCGCALELGTYFDNGFRRARNRPTVVHLTPYHLELLYQRRFRPGAPVDCLTIGAGPLSRDLAGYAAGLCDQLHVTYGASEAGPRVTSGRVQIETFVDGWIGYPLADVKVSLSSEGELQLATPYAHLDGTEISTGDRVDLKADQSLIFRDRLKDLLRLRGQSVSRQDYQHKLRAELQRNCQVVQHPYTDALTVFLEGRPDEKPESSLRAFPELKGAQMIWLKTFPRTALGKIDRQRLESLRHE